MQKFSRLTALAVFFAMALTIVGCSAVAKQPAPSGEQPVSPNVRAETPGNTMTVAIFFADWQAQHLIPEMHQIPVAEGAALANTVVQAILAGPSNPNSSGSSAPGSLHRTLPADIKLVEPVSLQNGVAYVNLSKELENVRGAAGVAMALGSLRLSLTEIPGVEMVQVLIEGKKDAMLDEGLALEPMNRGLYVGFPVFYDPERTKFLQARVDQGQESWRTDAAKAIEWEGRMFGFTAEELKTAKVTETGDQAIAEVAHADKTYVIQLAREAGKTAAIWTIRGASAK